MTSNKFRVGDDEILFYSNYLNVIRKEQFSSNKDDIVIRYSAIETIIHEKRGYIGLIVIGIILFLFGFPAFDEGSGEIGIGLFVIGLIFIVSYFVSLSEKIIIKSASHKELISYDSDVFDEILKKLDEFENK